MIANYYQAVTHGLAATGLVIADRWGDFDGRQIRPDSPEWIIPAKRN
jgi:hypothetical protein